MYDFLTVLGFEHVSYPFFLSNFAPLNSLIVSSTESSKCIHTLHTHPGLGTAGLGETRVPLRVIPESLRIL